MKKKILVFALSIALVFSVLNLPAPHLMAGVAKGSANVREIFSGLPVKSGWAIFGNETSYTDTSKGTEIVFDEGVNLNQRLAFKHKVDLDGFGIKISDISFNQARQKKLPIILGNDNIFTWHDKLSVAFIFDLTQNEITIRKNNGNHTGLNIGTITGFNFSGSDVLDVTFSRFDNADWSIMVNEEIQLIPASWIEGTVVNISSASFGIGGDWDSGEAPLSYTVEELRATNAYDFTYKTYSGLPLENSWTPISSTENGYYFDTQKGTGIAFDVGVTQDDRVGFNYNVNIDGFGFLLEDLDYIPGTGKRLPFNFGNAGNQSWHFNQSLQFILLIDEGVLAIQPEKKAYGSSLIGVSLGGFNTYGATSLDISFNKVSESVWTTTINGVTREIPAEYINEQINNQSNTGFALGGAWYSESAHFGYTVTELRARNADEFTYQFSGPEIYRGRPSKNAWDTFGENLSYNDTQNGTEVLFTQGVNLNQRLGFRYNFDLDGFGIKLSNLNVAQAEGGKVIPIILGNHKEFTWSDKVSVGLLIDLNLNRVVLQRFDVGSYSEQLGALEGYSLSGVSSLDITFNKLNESYWSLAINGISQNIPSAWLEESIKNVDAVSLGIGGDWSSSGAAVAFTVTEMYGKDAEDFIFSSYVNLIKDPAFNNGLLLGNVIDGIDADPNDTINFKNPDSNVFPTWEIAQWYSKYDIRDVTPVKEGNSYVFRNPGKIVTARDHSFTLELFGETEYGGEGWPHLIMSQDFASLPKLSEIDEARIQVNVRTHYLENHMQTEDPSKHTSRLTMAFVIQNRNPSSLGFGDYYWLQLPLFDKRTNQFGGWESADNGGKEVVTGKYMVSPDGSRFYNGTFDLGKTIKIDCDVYGLMIEGYYKTVTAGYLENSNFEDMTIAGISWGWEMMGAYNSSTTISAYALDIHYTD